MTIPAENLSVADFFAALIPKVLAQQDWSKEAHCNSSGLNWTEGKRIFAFSVLVILIKINTAQYQGMQTSKSLGWTRLLKLLHLSRTQPETSFQEKSNWFLLASELFLSLSLSKSDYTCTHTGAQNQLWLKWLSRSRAQKPSWWGSRVSFVTNKFGPSLLLPHQLSGQKLSATDEPAKLPPPGQTWGPISIRTVEAIQLETFRNTFENTEFNL